MLGSPPGSLSVRRDDARLPHPAVERAERHEEERLEPARDRARLHDRERERGRRGLHDERVHDVEPQPALRERQVHRQQPRRAEQKQRAVRHDRSEPSRDG